jgi:hypothetical protein
MIALMTEAARTSETSVNFKVTTRRYIPEDSKLQSPSLRTYYHHHHHHHHHRWLLYETTESLQSTDDELIPAGQGNARFRERK